MRNVVLCWVAVSVAVGVAAAQDPPPWSEQGAPRDLKLTLEALPGARIAGRAANTADHRIPRAGKVAVDARFDDWANADWIVMSGEPYHIGDNVWTTVTIEIPEGVATADDLSYLGFEFDQMDPDYERKYLLDEFYNGRGMVVTDVKAGSLAAQAGLREGDVIFETNGNKTGWGYELWRDLSRLAEQAGPQTITFKVKRNGRDRIGGADDLSARIAFLVDDENLYFAAQVTDDVHAQTKGGYELWMNDSIQIGLDPVLDRTIFGYREDSHEIGFALADGKPTSWRWKTRRTMPEGMMENVTLAIERRATQTLYEAAIPLAELAPLSPDMWPHCGINVVVNDSDDGLERKGRLELEPWAMTRGKHLDRFHEFEFAPSPNQSKVSVALFWDWGGNPHANGRIGLTIVTRSPRPNRLRVTARLTSESRRDSEPMEATVGIPVTAEPKEWFLRTSTRSHPGHYRIDVTVGDADGRVMVAEGIPFYIAPAT